jgi:hypothetical protein
MDGTVAPFSVTTLVLCGAPFTNTSVTGRFKSGNAV